MGRVSRARPSERGQPDEWKQGSRRARAARRNVAAQVRDHVVESDLTGSTGLVARRVRDLSAAENAHDPLLRRAAALELATAAAAYAVQIDLELPPGLIPPPALNGNGLVVDLDTARAIR